VVVGYPLHERANDSQNERIPSNRMERKKQLLQKIENRQAKIGVVGLGYVGLPLAVAFAQAGFTVIGVDVSQEKVASLQAGQSYIDDVPAAEIAPLLANGRFQPTTDYHQLASTDAISICVPTPLRKTKDPDIAYIINAKILPAWARPASWWCWNPPPTPALPKR
jgi:UDP-N-acetyl-D-glucosamine dehydrogenase